MQKREIRVNSMRKTGQTATRLEGTTKSAESVADRKSFTCKRLRPVQRAKSNHLYHMLARKNLPDTPTTATRQWK
jgi:hypothetical protein